MPKYYEFKVCGYYLYYTSHCVIEAMHVHASDRKLTEAGSAKFFVRSSGETTVENSGTLTDREIRIIREFIKDNYKEMYLKWSEKSDNGFYGEKEICNVGKTIGQFIGQFLNFRPQSTRYLLGKTDLKQRTLTPSFQGSNPCIPAEHS